MKARTNPQAPARRFGVWTWLGISAAALLVGAVLAAGWIFLGKKTWTDGGSLVLGEDARIRTVTWAPPTPLEGFNTSDQQYEPSLSPDGDELYFVRGKAGQNPPVPGQGAHIWVSYRRHGAWTPPEPVAAVNSDFDDLGPRVSPDGTLLLFYSNRPGGFGGYDIWAAPRLPAGNGYGRWGEPFNLGSNVNSEYDEYTPAISPDGRRLLFATNRKAAAGEQKQAWHATIRAGINSDFDLWYAERLDDPSAPATSQPADVGAPSSQRAAAQPLFIAASELPGVNTPYMEGSPCMSPAGDFFYFVSDRPGGLGKFDIYRCRVAPDGTFGAVENVGPPINTPDNETDPSVALNGFRLYFSSDRTMSGSGTERATGAATRPSPGGYSLMQSDSREVFSQRATRPLPHVGWAWLIAALSLLALVPIVLFMRRLDDQRLNLLQKCLLFSLLIHVLITLASSVWTVSHDVYHYVRREQGLEPPIDLTLTLTGPGSSAAEIGAGIREQSSSDVKAPAATPIAAAPQVLANPNAVAAPTGLELPSAPAGASEPLVQIAPPHSARSAESLAATPLPPAPLPIASQELRIAPMEPTRFSAAESLIRSDPAAAAVARTGVVEVRIEPQAVGVDVYTTLHGAIDAALTGAGPSLATPAPAGVVKVTGAAAQPVQVTAPLAAGAELNITAVQDGVSRLNAAEGAFPAESTRSESTRQKEGSAPPLPVTADITPLPTSSTTGASLVETPHASLDTSAASAIAAARQLGDQIAVQPATSVATVAQLASPPVRSGPVATTETYAGAPGPAASTVHRQPGVAPLTTPLDVPSSAIATPVGDPDGSIVMSPGAARSTAIAVTADPANAAPAAPVDVGPVTSMHGSVAPVRATEVATRAASADPYGARQVAPVATTPPVMNPLAGSLANIGPSSDVSPPQSLAVAAGAAPETRPFQLPEAIEAAATATPVAPGLKVAVARPITAVHEAVPAMTVADAPDGSRSNAGASNGSDRDHERQTAAVLADAFVGTSDAAVGSASLATAAGASSHGAGAGPTGALTAAVAVPTVASDVAARMPVDHPNLKVAAGSAGGADGTAAAATLHPQPHAFAARESGSQPDRSDLAIAAAALIAGTHADGPLGANPLAPRIVAIGPRTTLAGPGVILPQDAFVLPKLTAPEPLAQRAPEQRKPLVEKRGGTAESEDAVDRGLAYLARQQESDGRWSVFSDEHARPDAHRKHPHDMACTGLATLAFLTADHTPARRGPYREAVRNALQFLISQQGSDGDLRGPAPYRGGGADQANLYDHGICTMALCEAALMTGDRRYRQAAFSAAQFIVNSQNKRGGWRYRPGEEGDMSVAGWQLLALHDAEQLGFTVPPESKDRAKHFLGTISNGRTRILGSYLPGQGVSSAMTAESLFGRLLLGEQITPDQTREVCQYLTRDLPGHGEADFYFWYYASLSLSQMPDVTRADQAARPTDSNGHDPQDVSEQAWRTWNAHTRDTLIAMQKRTGPAAGSWWDSTWQDRGGRVFTTSLATLTLEVYYRYLPLKLAADAGDDGDQSRDGAAKTAPGK